jgi:MFS transporter, UMF1 family
MDAAQPTKGLSAGGIAWALFEAARIPLVILVTIYVFTPYFATVVVGDPVKGQAAVAASGKWGGWIVALTAPFIGATLDRYGPRKPFLAPVVMLLGGVTSLYWFALPDGSGLTVPMVIAMGAIVTVLYAYADLGQNSLLPMAAPGQEHRASGFGLALGNILAIAALIFVLTAFVWPDVPLFGLDKASHEPDRITGPIAGAFVLFGSLPLFLLSPDARRTGLSVFAAFRAGLTDLAALVRDARAHRNVLTFLAARMFYADGTVAILLFSGVYAAGVLGWRTGELLTFGILQGLFAVVGGFLAVWLDGRFGARRALQVQILMILLAQLAILGLRPDMLFYVAIAPGVAVWDGPMFRTAPEIAYILVGFINAAAITATYASSRTLLVKLVPAEAVGRFFGLYTLSGSMTYWLAPTLIQLFTLWFATQQAGYYPVLGLLLLGLVLLGFVRTGQAP